MQQKKIFLQAEWRKLAMANYVVNPDILKKYLPHGTELDIWNGRCYVSLVGFMFLETKVLGVKIPFHVNFEEVNLRFYVRHYDGKEWKRGVVFIKEIVPKWAITLVANLLYGEHYETKQMSHSWETKADSLVVEYDWNTEKWNTFTVVAELEKRDIPEGSEAEFITEHYWGYTKIKDDKTSEYPVEHPRWQVYQVKEYDIDVDFEAVYGKDFAFLNNEQPMSVFLAEGSEIRVMKNK